MKKTIIRISIFFFCLFAFPWHCLAIDAWPGGAGTTIATYSDASGIVWHEGRQSLFIVRNAGTPSLIEINTYGTVLHSWAVAGDLEGITIAEDDSYLYIGIEYPERIVEFNLDTGELTGKFWNLSSWMNGTVSDGLESLAYRNGYFLAGEQLDGKIYVFNVNLSVSENVSHVETIIPYAPYSSDISGIDYNSNTGLTYAIFDTSNALLELNSSNAIANHYTLPGSTQEGIAVKTNCTVHLADVYIANDGDGTILKYTNYPISCIDADSDGVFVDMDCNDYDAAISANQNYYRDADGDGLGSSTPTPFCSLTAPAGYVANHNDQNDNDFDNDGFSAGVDCNDSDGSVSQNQTYYRDADSDGLGDAFTTMGSCSLSASEGYVTNLSDPADISGSVRYMTINGTEIDLFGTDVLSAEHADLNYYSDDWHEVIAVGLISKKAYVSLVRVEGDEVYVAKRVRINKKKKYTTVSISTDSVKQKFTTRFSRGKKFTWKVASSGSFKKSK
jgi:hypothetical protein